MASSLHKDLPDSELHEPKGVATANSDQVYVADGGGSGAWEDLPGVVVPTHAATHKGGGSDAIDAATQSVAGLLSAADKAKLDTLGSGSLLILVRNETGSQIDKGTLIAGIGWSVANDRTLIGIADKDDPDARPTIGVLTENLANNTNGEALIAGPLIGVDTSAWDVTDQLVLGNSGAFSRPPPDVDPFTGEVQNVGVVKRDDASDGVIHFLPDGMQTTTANQVFALAGSYGTPSKANPYVTDTDPRVVQPLRRLTVGSQGSDYTTIKAAVDAATTSGASAATPWDILVNPGTYTEDPMTIIPGISLSTLWPTSFDSVFIVAAQDDEDLFTCSGGTVSGFSVSGVTDAGKALFRMATPYSLMSLYGLKIFNCSTGFAISNGAAVFMSSLAVSLIAPGQTVTTGISITGAGSYLGIVSGVFSAPAGLLPFYTSNPIQTAIRVADQAEVYVVGLACHIAPKDTTADVFLVDGGSVTTLMSSDVSGCGIGVHIGSGGSDTRAIIQGCSFSGNYLNGKSENATGAIIISAVVDEYNWEFVAGSLLTGIMQLRSEARTRLVGQLSYDSTPEVSLELDKWFYSKSGTAQTSPATPVTLNSGLDVDVPAGSGVIVRHSTYNDVQSVLWNADTLTLNASTTNYIVYDLDSAQLDVITSSPSESAILLATAVTDGSGIRFLHQTRTFGQNETLQLHNYLMATRAILSKTGMAVTAGTSGRKFQVSNGVYYRALDEITYAGSSGDASFSAFYGSNGVSEVTSLTEVNNTQYDSAGTLTSMTSGYFRSDTVIITSDGRVSVIFGTEEFSTQLLAESAGLSSIPTFMEATGVYVARLIVEQGSDIASIIDERPTGEVVSGGGGAAITVHSDLAGLDADDHTQYLLGSGARAMSGSLNMGGHAVTNVGDVDGVDVSGHVSRHNPGGADALTTGTPSAVSVGASPSEGSAASFTRSDHQHGIAAGTPGSVSTANAIGSASSVSRSDHVHSGLTRGANDFSVFSNKATPVSADILLIEDSADSGNKKRISMSTLPAGVDTTAIHKATAAEISAMTAKTAVASNDVVVIEDSAASFVKKKVTIENLIAGNIFGNNAQSEESLAESTTTSATYQTKVTLTTPSLSAGTYRIGWSCEARISTSISYDVLVRVYLDGSIALASVNIEPKDTNSYYPISGFAHVTLTATTHTVLLQYSVESGQTARIRNARLEIWRVS